MRIYKHWAQRTETIDGIPVHAKAASNESPEAAAALLDRKFDYIRRRRKSETFTLEETARFAADLGPGSTEHRYDVTICEEMLEELDPKNIVTRNRYGALVLNSEDHVFIDIDYRRPTFMEWIGKPFGAIAPTNLDRVVALVEKLSRHPDCHGLAFRVYETRAGARLLVGGVSHTADSKESERLMKRCKADRQYQWMCRRQKCYRARLTPKPVRIQHRTLRDVRFPWVDAEAEARKAAWVLSYEAKAESFSVCRLATEIGARFGGAVVHRHDAACGVGTGRPLA